MIKLNKNIIGVSLIMLVALAACKDNPLPANPYDGQANQTDTSGNENNLDPNGIAGIHQNIFGPTCANSGCHDGTFEPDFRTIESSYNSLVFQPVTKPDNDGKAPLRVNPGDAQSSMIYLRLTTNLNDFEARMPLEVDPGSDWPFMSEEYIQNIATWIDAGAPNQLGELPELPNNEPQLNGVVAFADGNSSPLGRNGSNAPMNVPNGTFNTEVWFSLSDDTTPTGNLIIEKVLFSNKINDFTDTLKTDATYQSNGITYPGLKGRKCAF